MASTSGTRPEEKENQAEVVCVECGAAVPCAYVVYGEGNVRLTVCTACGSVADRYVELEGVLVFIDVVLHRVPAYRHLLLKWVLGVRSCSRSGGHGAQ